MRWIASLLNCQLRPSRWTSACGSKHSVVYLDWTLTGPRIVKFNYSASAFQQKVTPDICNHLATHGYAVVNSLFGDGIALNLRDEVLGLYRGASMHSNCTHLVKDNVTTLLEKHNIKEAELTLDASVQAKAPLCAQLNADRSLAVMLNLLLPQLSLDSQAIKLQVNSGLGGCFPCHFDSDETLDGRKITAIFYLNPGWTPDDGGCLRLYPFPQSAPVDIAPISDRMVLFASTRMMHRVLPSKAKERVCFTVWLSQSRASRGRPQMNRPALLSDGTLDTAQVSSFLLQPHIRKHVVKMVFADEWARSIEESHPEGRERSQAVEQHWKEVDIIRRALSEYMPVIQEMQENVLAADAKVAERKKLTSGLQWF